MTSSSIKDTDTKPEPKKGNMDEGLEPISSDTEFPESKPTSEARLIIKLPSEDLEDFRTQHKDDLKEGKAVEDYEEVQGGHKASYAAASQ